ncbi:PKS-ER domain-containing protein [Aphelenchoides besseyi]|nr:PKS-ER domain-containing protein [Aphelenchoides besseyi]
MPQTLQSRAIRYHNYGDPRKVLKLETISVNTDLNAGEVLVQWLAAPIDPLDMNLIEGNYAIRNSLPAIAGAEGVGRIEKVGTGVNGLKVGDRVLSLGSSTWTEFAVVAEKQLVKIRSDFDLISASQLLINPPTAYCMLKFYEDLKPGHFVIQNAANSGVGRAVIQIAHAWNLKSINIVRDRPNIEALRQELKSFGADYVFTESEFRSEGRKLVSSLGNSIKIAFNGVGGRSALAISAAVATDGTCVTYGGMSRQAHEFSTGSLVFKNLKAVGYSNGRWLRDPANREKRNQMFEELQELIVRGQLKPTPVQTHRLEDFAVGIARQIEGKAGKQMIYISDSEASKI